MTVTPVELPTKAQAELLAWLAQTPDAEVSGGSLIDFYLERAQSKGSYARGGYASNGWRRAGGTALANLRKRGFVRYTRTSWGTPHYRLTEGGLRALRQYTIKPGEVRKGEMFGWYLVVCPRNEQRTLWWASFSEFPDNCRSNVWTAKHMRSLAVALEPEEAFRPNRLWGDGPPWSEVVRQHIGDVPDGK